MYDKLLLFNVLKIYIKFKFWKIYKVVEYFKFFDMKNFLYVLYWCEFNFGFVLSKYLI